MPMPFQFECLQCHATVQPPADQATLFVEYIRQMQQAAGGSLGWFCKDCILGGIKYETKPLIQKPTTINPNATPLSETD